MPKNMNELAYALNLENSRDGTLVWVAPVIIQGRPAVALIKVHDISKN